MRDTKELLRETRDRIAPPPDVLGSLERRRHHRDQVRRGSAVVVAVVVALVGLGGWFAVDRDATKVPVNDPSRSDLGIFADVRGWIAYGDPLGREPGIWAVDPANPDAEAVLLDPDGGTPIAWSQDGSKLLILRAVGDPDTFGRQDQELLVLGADGIETPVARFAPWASPGGSFTPDGSQVIYGGGGGIYSVAADGGSPQLLYAGGGVYEPVLSPDGARLAFFQGHGDAENSLWVMNVDGTDKRLILGEDEAGRTPWSLQWSPDGTRLAFSRGGEDRSFGVVNADGSGLTFVAVQVAGSDAGPYWSPDGTYLAFATGSARSPSLAIARPDGTELRELNVGRAGPWNPLDPAPADDSVPAQTLSPTVDGGQDDAEIHGIFSSVGGWIAFESGGAYGAIAPDGSEQTVLLDGRRGLSALDWSPDGSRLLVIDGGELAVIEPDGSETTLVLDDAIQFDSASFSPDGATVVYAGWARGVGNQLLTVASDGSGKPRPLLEWDGSLYRPTYSPDGTRIAFQGGGGDHSHTINVVDADGTDVRVLIDATPPFDGASHIFGLEWSPDGSLLAVGLGDGLEGQGIYTVRLDGTDLRLLIPGAVNPAWSPDGSLIAYSPYRADLNRGVWVANADGSDPRMLSPGGLAGPWNPGSMRST